MDPITAATWKKFNHKMQWDIITALRGPDAHRSDTIKWATTNVIRHRMINITSTHGSVNEDLGLVILPYPTPHYGQLGQVDLSPMKMVTNPDGTWDVVPAKSVKKVDKTPPAPPPIAFWAAEHFLQHTREAAEFLDIPILHCPLDVWEEAMAMGIHSGMKHILKGIKAEMEVNKKIEEGKASPRRVRMLHYDPDLVAELERHVTGIAGGY